MLSVLKKWCSKVKQLWKQIQGPCTVLIPDENGFWIKGVMAPWRRRYVEWKNIVEVLAHQIVPAPLGISIEVKNEESLYISQDTGGWDLFINKMCEVFPSFSLSKLEEARKDPFEGVHVCWKRD